MKEFRSPSLIMETSWEVCNKVGGIYTVLSSRAATMMQKHGEEGVLFVGPLLKGQLQEDFVQLDSDESAVLSAQCGFEVNVGVWNVPGRPKVALVDYTPLFHQKGELYYEMWKAYGIRGELGYGDYDESCLFAIAAAKLMEVYQSEKKCDSPVAIFNEWTTGMGLLYSKLHNPSLRTIFITHATTVGRSIAGNGKPLYGELMNYNGVQMADELNVTCKHAVEQAAAHHADAFATVSDVTAREAAQLLSKKVDAVLYNGFERSFVPSAQKYKVVRERGREVILRMAECLYGTAISSEAMIIATSGRNEYRNKGLDIFIDALGRLSGGGIAQDVIAVIAVPSWVKAPRGDLQYAMSANVEVTMPMQYPFVTHVLNEPWGNQVFAHLSSLRERWGHGVFPLFVPDYLDGKDGVLNMTYYDFLTALDLTVFPSYYEPWGYTPLESIAFGVPTITTDKSGFGLWAIRENAGGDLSSGVRVLHRDDYNFEAMSERLVEAILDYSNRSDVEHHQAQVAARLLAEKADWEHFYTLYERVVASLLKLSGDV